MKVKILSPEMFNSIEADALDRAESSMRGNAMVSYYSLYRGLRSCHDMRWILCKLGRSSVFSKEYAGTSQSRRGLTNDAEEVGLTDSTRSIGKLCTWGSGQQWNVWLSTSQINTPRL